MDTKSAGHLPAPVGQARRALANFELGTPVRSVKTPANGALARLQNAGWQWPNARQLAVVDQNPNRRLAPRTSTKAAARSSTTAMVIAPPAPRPPARRSAMAFANTAKAAIIPVVSAVPRAMARVAATPAANTLWARAKTRTTIAPLHGRLPAARTTPAISRQRVIRSRTSGGGK